MKITTIELQHTNPSLGPHETITTVTLQSNSTTAPTIQEFIHNSTVNQTCSLANYLEAELKDGKTLIQQVYANQPKNDINEGEQISNLIFHFEGGEIFEVSDVYRRFTLTNFYGEFTKYMVDNGSITKIDNTIERPKPMKD